MLATSSQRPFTEDAWLFELEYNGFRILVLKEAMQSDC